MPKHLAQVNSTIPNLERYRHKCQTKKKKILFDFLSLSSHKYVFLSQPAFFPSPPLSSLDLIPSPSLTLNLNLKCLSFSLHLKSNPNKLLSSLFIEWQSYGLESRVFGSWVCWLRRRWGFWFGGWLSLLVDGLVRLGFWVGDWLRQ